MELADISGSEDLCRMVIPVDINMSEISLSKLAEEVVKKGHPTLSRTTHVFTYSGSSASHDITVVSQDADLHMAVLCMSKTLTRNREVSEAVEIELCLSHSSLVRDYRILTTLTSVTKPRSASRCSSLTMYSGICCDN